MNSLDFTMLEDRTPGPSDTRSVGSASAVSADTLRQLFTYSSSDLSIVTIAKDFSGWNEAVCKPFLLEAIQGETLRTLQTFTDTDENMRRAVMRYLEIKRNLHQGSLSFLDFPAFNHSPSSLYQPDLFKPCSLGTSETSSSRQSLSSQSSTSSMKSFASQVSDSYFNDVQQSILLLQEDLKRAHKDLTAIENNRHSFRRLIRRRLDGEAGYLETIMLESMNNLQMHSSELASIGFPDLGLELNTLSNAFRTGVLQVLSTAKRQRGTFKQVKDALSKIKPTKKKTSSTTKTTNVDIKERYRALGETITEITRDIQKQLRTGFDLRDKFLRAAYEILIHLAEILAQTVGIEVYDSWNGSVLVSRQFVQQNVSLRAVPGLEEPFQMNERDNNMSGIEPQEVEGQLLGQSRECT